jgi:hypothetical protein
MCHAETREGVSSIANATFGTSRVVARSRPSLICSRGSSLSMNLSIAFITSATSYFISSIYCIDADSPRKAQVFSPHLV